MTLETGPSVSTELKVVLAGLGGQGVLFTTRLLARTAVALGRPVIASETHGMSQRGGSVLSHLKIGGTQAPLIRRGTADVLLALEADEAVRSLPYLIRGGVAFANAEDGLRPEVMPSLERLNIRIHCLPAGRMAMELGAAPVANVVMVGFAAAHPSMPMPVDALRRTLEKMAPQALEINVRALEAGYQAGCDAFAGAERPGSKASA